MEHWPLHARQEFSFALALAPAFDVYVIEGAIPFEPCRFTVSGWRCSSNG